MKRWIASGLLIGLLLGMFLYIIFPQIIEWESAIIVENLNFSGEYASTLQPNYYSSRVGTPFKLGLFPIVSALFGGLIGMISFKLWTR